MYQDKTGGGAYKKCDSVDENKLFICIPNLIVLSLSPFLPLRKMHHLIIFYPLSVSLNGPLGLLPLI